MEEFQMWLFLGLEAGIFLVFVRQTIVWHFEDIKNEQIQRERNKRLETLAVQWERLAEYLDEKGVDPLTHILQSMKDAQWAVNAYEWKLKEDNHVST